ncbi:putative P-loop containing nucleoside triphosphate hydrolase, thymidylate kinase-like protein [Helianthus anomalus]
MRVFWSKCFKLYRIKTTYVRTVWLLLNNNFIYRNFGALAAQRSSNLRFSYKSASRRVRMENNHHSDARGALIVLEGLDRSGKTSQSGRLVSYLNGLGHPVESWRFPDRDNDVGKMISAYLSNES